MSKEFLAALRRSSKGTGWSKKHDTLTRLADDWVLAVHPCRGYPTFVEFHAKPRMWDRLLWSILQIDGNDTLPASFHFWGAFTCSTPALVSESTEHLFSQDDKARYVTDFAQRCHASESIWRGYHLQAAIDAELHPAPYAYHMTRVVERIHAGDRNAARAICEQAEAGLLDIRQIFSSTDGPAAFGNLSAKSLSFFELALIWMARN